MNRKRKNLNRMIEGGTKRRLTHQKRIKKGTNHNSKKGVLHAPREGLLTHTAPDRCSRMDSVLSCYHVAVASVGNVENIISFISPSVTLLPNKNRERSTLCYLLKMRCGGDILTHYIWNNLLFSRGTSKYLHYSSSCF